MSYQWSNDERIGTDIGLFEGKEDLHHGSNRIRRRAADANGREKGRFEFTVRNPEQRASDKRLSIASWEKIREVYFYQVRS